MDPLIGQSLQPEYTIVGVAFSYLCSFFGSLVALLCARRIVRADGTLDRTMLVCAAVALGGIGIWGMHFIGMGAYRLPIAVAYNVPITLVSLVAAIFISGVALYMAGGRRFNRAGWIGGSLLAGAGACVMHYLGMSAMTMRARMDFDPTLVALSVLIAVVAAAAALWLAFNLHNLVLQIVAALVMGVAVSAMHYVGMAAADMICTAPVAPDAFAIGGSQMWLAVFGVSGSVLIGIGWLVTGRMLNPISAQRASHG